MRYCSNLDPVSQPCHARSLPCGGGCRPQKLFPFLPWWVGLCRQPSPLQVGLCRNRSRPPLPVSAMSCRVQRKACLCLLCQWHRSLFCPAVSSQPLLATYSSRLLILPGLQRSLRVTCFRFSLSKIPPPSLKPDGPCSQHDVMWAAWGHRNSEARYPTLCHSYVISLRSGFPSRGSRWVLRS